MFGLFIKFLFIKTFYKIYKVIPLNEIFRRKRFSQNLYLKYFAFVTVLNMLLIISYLFVDP